MVPKSQTTSARCCWQK